MTAIRGVFGAVDELGAAYRNDAEDVRAMLYHALGGTEGILEGFVMSTVSAAMEVDFTAGRALIAERGVDITAEDRGYYVFADDVTTVTFDAASVADRCDAVVFAWPDPQYGSLGASVAVAGPQIVVVKGVSGSTTPRTDSEINTAIGVGGWFRYADVVIDSADTEINPASIDLTYPDALPDDAISYAANAADLTNGSRVYRRGNMVILFVECQLTAGFSANQTILTVPAGYLPARTVRGGINLANVGVGTFQAVTLDTDGTFSCDGGLVSGSHMLGTISYPLA